MSGLEDSQLVQNITNVILKAVKKAIDEAPFDRTFTATIVKQNNTRSYEVAYNGKHMTVTSVYECELGDIVRVCAPSNDWSKLFVVANAGHEYDPGTDEGTISGGFNVEVGSTASKSRNTLLFDTDNS